MKILIAEDDNLILRTIELKLKKEGYSIITATDGLEAIKKINEELPDLVLTDIMLPYASGLEVVGAVKKVAQKEINVIVLSAMGQEKVVEEAFELGADDFIPKPFSITELLLRLKRFSKKHGQLVIAD